jgi:hypothetical protein
MCRRGKNCSKIVGFGAILQAETCVATQVFANANGPVPGSNFQYSGWMTEANHLGNVAYRTGKKIGWDHKAMRSTNASEAEPFIRRPQYRKGWEGILKA